MPSRIFHIPPDLVVDRWAADGESGSHHDFRFRHDVWTMLFHQIGEGITSIISIAWYFTTQSGGICSCPLAFRHQVRRLTSRISSESYPGSQECVTHYHGAGEFTCVHHTIHPAPSPPDAGRDTVPSRFGCQSGACGYRVRRRCTGRDLPAHLRRILLMEQQVWSLQRARRSTVRPRVAADNQPCDLVSQPPRNSVECGHFWTS